jgi:hypothetical protein
MGPRHCTAATGPRSLKGAAGHPAHDIGRVPVVHFRPRRSSSMQEAAMKFMMIHYIDQSVRGGEAIP